jgi:hypothetical protein
MSKPPRDALIAELRRDRRLLSRALIMMELARDVPGMRGIIPEITVEPGDPDAKIDAFLATLSERHLKALRRAVERLAERAASKGGA